MEERFMLQSSEDLLKFVKKFHFPYVKSPYGINMILIKLNCLDSPKENWAVDCFFLGDICRWSGIIEVLCSSRRQNSPFVRIACYKIKPEVAFYSLPQSFKQTKKTANSNLCSSKFLLFCDAYKKNRGRSGSWWLLSIVLPIWFCYYFALPSCPHPISLYCKAVRNRFGVHNTEGNGNWLIIGNLVIERKNNDSSTNIKNPITIQTLSTMPASSHSRHYC